MSGACVHELADGTPTPRFRPYYITFYWLSSPWREQKERCERRARLEARKKTGKPAPWIRTHKSSILHVSMAPGNNVRFAIFFFPSPILFPFATFFFSPSRFALFVSLFFLFLFSFVYLLFFPFFLFFPWDQRHAGYEIKGKRERGEEEEEERPVEFRNDAVCVGLFRTNSALCTYRWVISSVERNLIITR